MAESTQNSGVTDEQFLAAIQEQADGSVVVGGTEEDARLGGSGDEADSQEDHAELAAASSDEERDDIRARRRQERQDRKKRQRDREDGLRQELSLSNNVVRDLQERLAQVEQRGTQADLAQLEAAIGQARNAHAQYKQIISAAIARQDGAGAAEATERMMGAERRFHELSQVHAAAQAQRNAPAPLDPHLVNHAQKWIERNTWYDPQGRDADSRVLLAVDAALAQDGLDPRTPAYWEELDRRKAKYLPHRTGRNTPAADRSGYTRGDSPANQRPSGRSVVTGSGNDSGAGYGSAGSSEDAGAYRLSAERVAAIKDAGMWDDPKSRAEMIKSYHDYDRKSVRR